MIFNSNNQFSKYNSCKTNHIEIKGRTDRIKLIEMIDSIGKIIKINKINMTNSMFNKNTIIKINLLKNNKNRRMS